MIASYPKASFVFLLLLFICLTNRWMSFTEGTEFLHADDSRFYLAMSDAAPSLPEESMMVHHAQRIIPHYLLGAMKVITPGIPVSIYYRLLSLILILLNIYCLVLLLDQLRLSLPVRMGLLSLFVLNPYTIRYYLIAPVMVSDNLFQLGSTLVLLALAKAQIGLLFLALAVATIGRQNSILILPAVVVWILSSKKFIDKLSLSKRSILAGLSVFIIWALLFVLRKLTESFGQNSIPFAHVVSILSWFSSDLFTWAALMEHLVRTFIPLFLLTSFLSVVLWNARKEGLWRRIFTPELISLLLMVAGLISVSLLSRPDYIQQSQARYSSFALVPGVYLLGRFCEQLWGDESGSVQPLTLGFASALLFLAGVFSLHHLYSWFGPPSAAYLALFAFLCTIGCLSCFHTAMKRV
jgi:hypothetical protein